MKLNGEENESTLTAANNYASSLADLRRFEEAKPILRKSIPIARRVFGVNHEFTLTIRLAYAKALYKDDCASLDELREAETTLEDAARIARRVLGIAHPTTHKIELSLRGARAVILARETGDLSSLREAMEAMTSGGA